MPVYALEKPIETTKPRLVVLEVAGPTSYPAGGFQVTIADLKRIHFAVATFRGTRVTNLVYQLDVTWSGNTVTIKVMQIDVTATTAGWSEVAAGTDLSGLTFQIIAVGEA